MDLDKLEEIEGIMLYGVRTSLHIHTLLWSKSIDNNVQVIEELSDEKSVVCLNDGSSTRIDIRIGKESMLDGTALQHCCTSM